MCSLFVNSKAGLLRTGRSNDMVIEGILGSSCLCEEKRIPRHTALLQRVLL
jgi:hypothetical protein